ncbi:SHOCT domain-containing protein [bacterium]|nr:SHOCT domain-containing protein [bacterium]
MPPTPPPPREQAKTAPAASPVAETPATPTPAPVAPGATPAPVPSPASPAPIEKPAEPGPRAKESVVAQTPDPGELPLTVNPGPTLAERIALATTPALRTRRLRIEARIFELAQPVGALALEQDGIRRTKNVDLDRVLKKIDRVDDAIFDLEEGEAPREGILGKISAVPGRLSDKVEVRELRAKRARLVAELGLAILAVDLRSLRSRSPQIAVFAESHAEAAREVDGLFRQSRLVDDELDARARDGRLWKEPKVIDKLFSRTGEVVDDVSDRAADKLKGFGKSAAKAAAKGGWSLAKGAFAIGKEKVADRAGDDDEDEDVRPRRRSEDDDEDDEDRPRRRSKKERERESDATSSDLAERLRQLSKLHREGILTDEEYARKKEDLLRRM